MEKKMKVLISCEYSGTVRDAFIKKGHDAISCDLLPTDSPGPHFKGNIEDILYSRRWDLIIAHPPCTYMSNSGVRWLYQKDGRQDTQRWMKLIEAMMFFNLFKNHPCRKIAIENPIPHKYAVNGIHGLICDKQNIKAVINILIMKTLEEIKNELAQLGGWNDWWELYNTDGITNVMVDEVSERYARSVAEGLRERIVQGSFLTEKNWVRNVEIILP